MIQLLLASLLGRLGKSFWFLLVVFVAFGLVGMPVLFAFEGWDHNFKDWVDYLSWWTGTTTTTGFPAMPSTLAGRLWDGFYKIPLFLSGFGFFGALVARLIEYATRTNRGLGTFSGKGHIVVIGWNSVTAKLMEEYASAYEVILVDETLTESPDSQIAFFVRGRASLDATLQRAGVGRATVAIVGLPSDGATGLTAASAKRLNSEILLITVALEVENIDRLGETGATVLCPVKKIAEKIHQAIGARPAVVFGKGPVVTHLQTLVLDRVDFSDRDPAVDAELIKSGVNTYPVVVIVPKDDEHAWLAVSSVRAQKNEFAEILVVAAHEENIVHLTRAGADLVLCPTSF